MLAYVRKYTYLSAAKNSSKEYLTYGKGKHKIFRALPSIKTTPLLASFFASILSAILCLYSICLNC